MCVFCVTLLLYVVVAPLTLVHCLYLLRPRCHTGLSTQRSQVDRIVQDCFSVLLFWSFSITRGYFTRTPLFFSTIRHTPATSC